MNLKYIETVLAFKKQHESGVKLQWRNGSLGADWNDIQGEWTDENWKIAIERNQEFRVKPANVISDLLTAGDDLY